MQKFFIKGNELLMEYSFIYNYSKEDFIEKLNKNHKITINRVFVLTEDKLRKVDEEDEETIWICIICLELSKE